MFQLSSNHDFIFIFCLQTFNNHIIIYFLVLISNYSIKLVFVVTEFSVQLITGPLRASGCRKVSIKQKLSYKSFTFSNSEKN
jgi:hypothetical protein